MLTQMDTEIINILIGSGVLILLGKGIFKLGEFNSRFVSLERRFTSVEKKVEKMDKKINSVNLKKTSFTPTSKVSKKIAK